MKALLLITMLCFASPAVFSQPQSGLDRSDQVFRLDGGDVSYVFGVNERGELQSVYWGGRLQASDRFPAVNQQRAFLPSRVQTAKHRRSIRDGEAGCSGSRP